MHVSALVRVCVHMWQYLYVDMRAEQMRFPLLIQLFNNNK